MQIVVQFVLSQSYKEMKIPDKAIEHAQQVVALTDDPAYEQQKMESLLLIGSIYVEKELWQQVAEAYEPTLPYLTRSGDNDRLSLVTGFLSFAEMSTGDYV